MEDLVNKLVICCKKPKKKLSCCVNNLENYSYQMLHTNYKIKI